MKNHYSRIAVLSCVFLVCTVLRSQEKYGHVTPQTADFIKYGEIPVSLFHGRMSLDVPIYRIKDPDFDIPVSLLYTADGFKPEKRSDLVGLDWTLVAGGCITREIYGSPDDFRVTSSMSQEDGFMRVVQNEKFRDRDKIWNMDPSLIVDNGSGKYCQMETTGEGFFREYQPDLFLFNFHGHTGQFMINKKGQGQANHPGYKIDISGLTEQPSEILFQPYVSTLRITTPDGYLYEFGGNLDALEYSVSYREGYVFALGEFNPTLLAWHLSKITAPNGRVVTFHYEHPWNLFDKWSPLWQAGRGRMTGSPSSGQISVSATKKAILESIEVDNVKVEFRKSLETTLGSGDYFFLAQSTYNHAIYQLDSVIIKYNNETRYSYSLGYENRSKRRFLSSVTVPGGGRYLFSYSHANYPVNMSAVPAGVVNGDGIDDFGYWTNNNTDSSYGLMSKITYPTGGYSLFAYERHQYSYVVELRLPDLTRQLVPASSQIIHGARIKTVTGYTSSSVREKAREYIYSGNINGGSGSGILYQSRPYTMSVTGQKVYIMENSWNKNYNIDEPAIGYSTVIERSDDGSYTRYQFTGYLDNPDTGDNINLNIVYPEVVPDYASLSYYSVNRFSSNSAKRGLLIEESVFDSTGVQKSQEQNLYRHVSVNRIISLEESGLICGCDYQSIQHDSSYIVSFRGFSGGGVSRKIYLKAYPQVQRKIKRENVTGEEWYRYNRYGQLYSKSTVSGQSDTLRTNYSYPFDYTAAPYPEMVMKNMLSPVVEEVTVSARGSTQTEVGRTKTDYIKDVVRTHSLILPDRRSSSYSGPGNLRTDVTCDLYNGNGRLLQYSLLNGTVVTRLWGYNHQYPVAEIEGASYAGVTDKIPESTLNSLALQAEPSSSGMQAVSNLRVLLPNAQITTYTYEPLVGVKTITDPRGITTYYEYDAFGRLNRTYIIENGMQKTIQTYDYHYKNQQ